MRIYGSASRLFVCGLVLAGAFSQGRSYEQTPHADLRTFPEKILEGTDRFDVALTVQGDLRGNFGPCG